MAIRVARGPGGGTLVIPAVASPLALDVGAYRRDGYLVVRERLFSEAELARLDSIAADWQRRAAAGDARSDLNVPHFDDVRLFDFLVHPAVLDLVQPFIGEDIAIWTSQFFCKLPAAGQSIGWHADGHYWRRFLTPVDVVSLWLALDDVSTGNGGLRILPGSHRQAHFTYVGRRPHDNPFFPRRVPDDQIPQERVVDIELARGECVMFDGELLHASGANTSGRRRFAYTMRYMPTSCRFDAVDLNALTRAARVAFGACRRRWAGHDIYRHRIYLARGRDRAGNRYAPVPERL